MVGITTSVIVVSIVRLTISVVVVLENLVFVGLVLVTVVLAFVLGDEDCFSDGLQDIANRPYWSRFWVIQEFLLAKDVIICCGKARIDWLRFRLLICQEAGIPENDENFGRPDSPTIRAISKYRALSLVMGRNFDKDPENQQLLVDLLVAHHQSECKDPRDRVFSLMGLVTPLKRKLLGRFFPDYSMETDHVRIIALAHIIQCAILVPSHWMKKITPESDELFLGLDVVSKEQRTRLLKNVVSFGEEIFHKDYFDDAAIRWGYKVG